MIAFRTLLAIALTCLGTYYAFVSLQVLVNVSEVTSRWIHLSGDLDFRFDADLFRALIGSGAAAVLAFGLVTVICGIRTASGRLVSCNYRPRHRSSADLSMVDLQSDRHREATRVGAERSLDRNPLHFDLCGLHRRMGPDAASTTNEALNVQTASDDLHVAFNGFVAG